MKEIKIIINKEGEVLIDIIGGKGPGCSKLLKPLIEAVGELKVEKTKDSFYMDSISNINMEIRSLL